MVRACVAIVLLKFNKRRGCAGWLRCLGVEDAACGGGEGLSKKLRDAASLEGFLRSGR